jgi:hypothetical protein
MTFARQSMYIESIYTAGFSLSLNAATASQNLAVLSEKCGTGPAAIDIVENR